MSEEVVEYEYEDVAQIESWKIDKMVEEVKNNNAELERYKEIRDRRIEEIKQQYKEKEDKILKRNYFILSTLREYASLQKYALKSTKTQYKLPLLSGDIIIKKSIPKVVKPESEKIEEIEKLFPEYVEKVEEKRVNWKELKKQLIIDGNRIIDANTGEDVTDLFDIEVNEEEVIVK